MYFPSSPPESMMMIDLFIHSPIDPEIYIIPERLPVPYHPECMLLLRTAADHHKPNPVQIVTDMFQYKFPLED